MSDPLEILNQIVEYITKAPPVMLIVIALNALGLVLKRAPAIPNRCIPYALILVGVVLMPLIGALPEGTRNPEVTLGLMGFIFGCSAWLLHAVLLRHLEKFLPEALRPEPTEPPKEL